jgi:hypothetical protein
MRKYLIILCLLIGSILLFPTVVNAADQTLYVRDGAAGTGTGADWTNACEELSLCEAKVDRETYDNVYIYVADGNYAGTITFNSVENGSRMVYIWKATVGSHGTETGWDNAYGDGQAVITAGAGVTYYTAIKFQTGYYELNGKAGSGSDYGSYGFKIISPGDTKKETLVGLPAVGDSSRQIDHINIKYAAIICSGVGSVVLERIGIYSAAAAGYESEDILISHCYFSGGHVNIYPFRAKRWTIENSYFADNWSSGTTHGEQIAPKNADDLIIRNNIFKNTTLYVIGSHCSVSGVRCNFRYQIYNNIIDGMAEGKVLNSAFGNATTSYHNTNIQWEVHHNTVLNVDFTNTMAQGFVFTGVMDDPETDHHHVYNNLFYNCTNPRLNHTGSNTAGQVVHDNNAFIACTAGSGGEVPNEDHDQTDATATNPFTNSAGGVYTINTTWDAAQVSAEKASLIGKGKTDLVGYGTDAAGNSRDATPDIGAFESGASADTTAPTLAEVTPVTASSSNQAPVYVFSSDEAGTVTYGGDCGNGSLSTAVVGNNTVEWNLGIGTYSNCTITVTDTASNASTPLAVTEFVITPVISSASKVIEGGVVFQGLP